MKGEEAGCGQKGRYTLNQEYMLPLPFDVTDEQKGASGGSAERSAQHPVLNTSTQIQTQPKEY